jgi:hypothetical protein
MADNGDATLAHQRAETTPETLALKPPPDSGWVYRLWAQKNPPVLAGGFLVPLG